MKKNSIAALVVACTAACHAASAADRPLVFGTEPPPRVIQDRLAFEFSLLPASLTTDARVDETADSPGTAFNAEDDFGLADFRVLPAPELTLRPGQRHLFRLSSLVVRRRGTVVLERDIDYDDDSFEEGDIVDSTLDLTLFGLTYGYEILQEVDHNVALTFGVQAVELKTNARARGQNLRQPSGDIVPVPALGIEGGYFFDQHWSVEGRFQYFRVSTDEIEGTYSDARLAVVWQVNPHLGVGLGYRLLEIDAESFDDDSAGLANVTIQAPLIFARATF